MFHFFIFICNIKIFFNLIILPFYKYKIFNFSNLENFQSNIYTEFEIGTPSQKIKMDIRFDTYSILISNFSKITPFNSDISKTFQILNSSTFLNYYRHNHYYAYTIQENLLIKNKYCNLSINNFSFIFGIQSDIITNKNFNCLGLQIKRNNIKSDRNFIEQLKKLNIINSYAFTVKYLDKDKGQIIIGEYPHEYNNEIYKDYNLRYVNTEYFGSEIEWKLNFNNVSFFNVFDSINEAKLDLNYLGILASNFYHEIIYDNIFKDLIEKNICYMSDIFDGHYFIYYCKENDILKRKFKPIYFYHKQLNYTFVLDYKDLFLKNNNIIYFMMVFNQYTTSFWVFGEIFFRKYEFVFDQDKKIMGFYCNNININRKLNNNKSLFIMIIIFILLIIIIMLLLFIKKIYNLKKKINKYVKDKELDFINMENDNNYYNIKLLNNGK